MSQLLWFPHSIAIALTHSVYIFEKMYVGTIIKVHFPPKIWTKVCLEEIILVLQIV